jgi:hypothetical protein
MVLRYLQEVSCFADFADANSALDMDVCPWCSVWMAFLSQVIAINRTSDVLLYVYQFRVNINF